MAADYADHTGDWQAEEIGPRTMPVQKVTVAACRRVQRGILRAVFFPAGSAPYRPDNSMPCLSTFPARATLDTCANRA